MPTGTVSLSVYRDAVASLVPDVLPFCLRLWFTPRLGRLLHRPPLDLLLRHLHGRCLCGVYRSPASLGCFVRCVTVVLPVGCWCYLGVCMVLCILDRLDPAVGVATVAKVLSPQSV